MRLVCRQRPRFYAKDLTCGYKDWTTHIGSIDLDELSRSLRHVKSLSHAQEGQHVSTCIRLTQTCMACLGCIRVQAMWSRADVWQS